MGTAARRRRVRLYWAAVGLVLGIFFLGCFHQIANFWQWGHNGFNGAAFSQAARNSLRFELLAQTPYYSGLDSPGPSHWYTDHPMMLHLHLVAMQRLFGYSEWANRLVPALYSFLALVMLFLLLLRLCGRAAALAGACIYALTPHNLIFANMINHEQGGIFWCLAFAYAYCFWIREGRWRHAAWALVCITMAAQFDWPAYYLAFFAAVHAFLTGLRRGPGWLRWRREYTFAAAFSAVVLFNFFGFFLLAHFLRGSVDHMIDSFFWRSGSQSGYLKLLLERALDLRGAALLALLGAWLPLGVFRMVRRRAGLIDLVAGMFLATQTIHSLVFQQAGRIHSYWTYYLGPVYAIGGALVLTEGWKALGLLRGRRLVPALRLGALAAGVLLLIFQAGFAYRQFRWGLSTGGAAYVQNYDDQFAEISWAREINRLFGREGVHYYIHSSVQRVRLEFTHTLDAPYSHQAGLHLPGNTAQIRRPVLLVDLNRLTGAAERSGALARLSARHHVHVWDRRFVAVEGGAGPAGLSAYVSRLESPSWWWRWLANPDRPPLRFGPDPYLLPPATALNRGSALHRPAELGGRGGEAFFFQCTAGQALDRLRGQTAPTRAHQMVSAIRPECRSVSLLAGGADWMLSPTTGPWLGRVRSAPVAEISCSNGELPVGIFGHSGALIDGLGLLCAPAGDRGHLRRTALIGNPGGSPFELTCPNNQVLSGLLGRATVHLHTVSILCAD